jgi:cytochrome c2
MIRWWRKVLTGSALLLVTGMAGAQPFAKGDAAAGKKLFDEAKCAACHAQRVGGDGSGMFKRADRRVKSADALTKQISFCVHQLGVTWFPEDEVHVAAYLNRQYYKFK